RPHVRLEQLVHRVQAKTRHGVQPAGAGPLEPGQQPAVLGVQVENPQGQGPPLGEGGGPYRRRRAPHGQHGRAAPERRRGGRAVNGGGAYGGSHSHCRTASPEKSSMATAQLGRGRSPSAWLNSVSRNQTRRSPEGITSSPPAGGAGRGGPSSR